MVTWTWSVPTGVMVTLLGHSLGTSFALVSGLQDTTCAEATPLAARFWVWVCRSVLSSIRPNLAFQASPAA
ncbi:hypothetical protein D3C85_1712660 [compost metagenome]